MPDDDDELREGDQSANPDLASSTAQVLAIAAAEAAEERRRAYEVTRPRILAAMFDAGPPAAGIPAPAVE